MRMLFAIALVLLAGCNRKPAAPVISEQTVRAEQAGQMPEETRRHWIFMNQVRQGDAFNRSIHRTFLTEEKQLGVVLYATVKPEAVDEVIRQAMTEMARKFPGEDVSVLVYMTASPPRKLGVARLDGKTGAITYTPS